MARRSSPKPQKKKSVASQGKAIWEAITQVLNIGVSSEDPETRKAARIARREINKAKKAATLELKKAA